MKSSDQSLAESVKRYCTQISQDPLLVQGAGGNVSWKDGGVLWVKASGTWLANAGNEEIFVPVDLVHLRTAMAEGNFSETPKLTSETSLKPSIETMLHALMPQKIVVHLHAVEILAHLVRENSEIEIQKLVGDAVKWVFVDYIKPGADLAHNVFAQLAIHRDADVVFLNSHGLVIGGESIDSIDTKLRKLLLQFKTKPRQFENNMSSEVLTSEYLNSSYVMSVDSNVNKLATNTELISRIKTDWALYPDHIVFLGEKAIVVNGDNDLLVEVNSAIPPNYIFVAGKGVYEHSLTTNAHRAQLRCYYDVLARQKSVEKLVTLSSFEVAELLNWDSEKYRQSMLLKSRSC
jgi:rhamnose utilization protein RhaD (predicted bifunctional aldolase and dehydrogenase)